MSTEPTQELETQFAGDASAINSRSHHDLSTKSEVSAKNFVQLLAIAAPGLSSIKVAKLLGNKCSHALVRHWRYGRRKPPQWAIDRLYLLAMQRIQRLTSNIDPGIARAILGTQNLKAFMARRARERDAKKSTQP